MQLGCEAPGIRLDLVTSGMIGEPEEAWEHIRLTEGSKSLLLKQRNDLRHSVRIADGQTALRYVRLLTSPETWFLWKNGKLAVEILEADAASKLPNFGLRRLPATLTSTVSMDGIKGGSQRIILGVQPRGP